jgi:hypothetical protein
MITPVPSRAELATTRRTMHLIAGHVLAEERWLRCGHTGLEPTSSGMRTPGAEPVGVELARDELVLRRDGLPERRVLTTLGAAQEWVLGASTAPSWGEQPGLHDPPAPAPPNTSLELDPDLVSWLGRWFQLGREALSTLSNDPLSHEPTVPTLWPEHFDVGIDLLSEDWRASYGVSPGDTLFPDPYAYVAVWYPDRIGGLDDPLWDATVLPGSVVLASEIATSADPGAALLSWFRARRDRLALSVA